MKRINEKTVRVYAITVGDGPFDGVYVGATASPLEVRRAEHVVYSHHLKSSRQPWLPVKIAIRDALADGRVIRIHELESIPPLGDWESVETFYVSQFKSLGMNVLNVSEGGVQGVSGWRHTKAARAKISEAGRGRKLNQRQLAALALARENRVYTPETLAKMRLASLGNKHCAGRVVSAKTRKRISGKLKNRPLTYDRSEETRAKLAEAKRAWWASLSESERAAVSAKCTHKGSRKPRSPEVKARITAGLKASWADRKARSA